TATLLVSATAARRREPPTCPEGATERSQGWRSARHPWISAPKESCTPEGCQRATNKRRPCVVALRRELCRTAQGSFRVDPGQTARRSVRVRSSAFRRPREKVRTRFATTR